MIIALDVQMMLEDNGYRVLGPAGSVDGALRSLEIPFVLSSAYDIFPFDGSEILEGAENVRKPVSEGRLLTALQRALSWAGARFFETAASATFPSEVGVEHGRQERDETWCNGGLGPGDARPTRWRRRGRGRIGEAVLGEAEACGGAAADAGREPGGAVARAERASASALGVARPGAAGGRERAEGARARRA